MAWSAGRVANVRAAASIQKTQPAGTAPVRPRSFGGGCPRSIRSAAASPAAAWKRMATGGAPSFRAAVRRLLNAPHGVV